MAERKRFLDEYETVQERIAKFYQKFPEGRIVTELASDPANWERCRYKAALFRSFEDASPLATGHAVEAVDDAKSAVNKAYHEENCESSAIGRALANAGFAPKGGGPAPQAEPAEKRQETPKPAAQAPKAQPAQESDSDGDHPVLQIIWDKAQGMGISPKEMKAFLVQEFGVPTSKALDDTQIARLAQTFEEIDTLEEFKSLLHEAPSSN